MPKLQRVNILFSRKELELPSVVRVNFEMDDTSLKEEAKSLEEASGYNDKYWVETWYAEKPHAIG